MDNEIRELQKIRVKINEFKQVLKEKKKKNSDCKCKNKGECIKILEKKIEALQESYNELVILYKSEKDK